MPMCVSLQARPGATALAVARPAARYEFAVAVTTLHAVRERDEMVEGEIAPIAAVDAAVTVAAVDPFALCSADPETCLLRRLVVADVVTASGAGRAA
jgi:hypothetical protein